jgi:hypothetical protein
MFKSIGTSKGIVNAIWFFLGLGAELISGNRQGMRLGYSLMGVDWILGCGANKWVLYLKIATPNGRALTGYEKRVVDQIVETFRYAQERVTLQTTRPAPTGVTAVGNASPEGILVSWTAVTGAASYAVFEASVPGVTLFNGARHPAGGTSLVINIPHSGVRRYYTVRAVNAQAFDGVASSEVTAVSA